VFRRIGFQDDALRPPRLLPGEVAQADAAAGAEGRGIVEHGMDFRIAGHAIDVPLVEPDHRSGFPEHLVHRMRIFEEFDRERIEVETGWLGHREHLRYNVVAELGLVSLSLD
jgi:hypothetical protein